ncbi:glycosyltransferase [Turicibacter sanguinis]|uniref:glycosyltransferase n=1 Tax=Turicibacter sanguinis TaxID=154288 RepID=UPI0018A8EDA6|nr:glycosyltransferase [Turicibacter sanguinis]MDB8558552.1 glycosyltransferase [Turicibacter sanguinis]MDB8561348.1 glycosyltransferase [Turicibacter sanguinis]
MKILFLSHTYIGGNYVVGSHHLAQKMYEKGHEVYHVSTPVTLFHKLLIKDKKKLDLAKKYTEEINKDDGVKNLIPLGILPWKLAKFLFIVSNGKVNLASKLINKVKIPKEFDCVFIDQPIFYGIEKKITAKKWVYRPTDVYPLLANDKSLYKLEKKVLLKCSSVICTSNPVKKHIENYNINVPINVVENGVNIQMFRNKIHNNFKENSDFNIVYIGAFDKRFDFDIIFNVAKKYLDFKFFLIGPMDNEKKEIYSNCQNVFCLGPIKYKDIPNLLMEQNVTILPMSSDESNQGRSPMKIYEYLAAGKIVIAKKTEELERRNEQNVYLYNTEEEFVNLLNNVKNGNIFYTYQDYSEHDWETKVNQLFKYSDI